MLFDHAHEMTKEKMDLYLNEVAKSYKKHGGKGYPIEIVLVGGSAIVAGYHFRNATQDIDAYMVDTSALKDAIREVAGRYHLPDDWMNADFTTTSSYSPHLRLYTQRYKEFGHILEVRTVKPLYLIAMKLKSFRIYKRDMSDVVGMINELRENGTSTELDDIKGAVTDLYGEWSSISDSAQMYIQKIIETQNLGDVYRTIKEQESATKQAAMVFQQRYPGVLNADNIEAVLEKVQSPNDNLNSAPRLSAYQDVLAAAQKRLQDG